MHSFCAANGLIVSIPETEVVVLGRDCAWKVAGQELKSSQSFTYLGMLFHQVRKIKHAVQVRFSKTCTSVGSMFSRYSNLQCANSVKLLGSLQQAIRQPCMAGKSGLQLMQHMACFASFGLCTMPSSAVHAVSGALFPVRLDSRSFL